MAAEKETKTVRYDGSTESVRKITDILPGTKKKAPAMREGSVLKILYGSHKHRALFPGDILEVTGDQIKVHTE